MPIQVKCFCVGSKPLDDELNEFLKSHDIESVTVSKRLAYDETDSIIVVYHANIEEVC